MVMGTSFVGTIILKDNSNEFQQLLVLNIIIGIGDGIASTIDQRKEWIPAPKVLIHVSPVNDVHPHVMVGFGTSIHRVGPDDESILAIDRISKSAIGIHNAQITIGKIDPPAIEGSAVASPD